MTLSTQFINLSFYIISIISALNTKIAAINRSCMGQKIITYVPMYDQFTAAYN
jgi:hypothetical protein